jgi:phenylacetate-CoA ligase
MPNTPINQTADGHLPSLELIREVFSRVKKNGLYGHKFNGLTLTTWEDFFSLPLTTKEDLRSCTPEDTLAIPITEVWHYHESFGTTGKPVSTWWSEEDFNREVDLTHRWTAPIQPGMRVLNRFPYSFAVPPFILETKCKRDGGVILPAGNLNWNVSYARTLDLIKRVGVEAIGCLPLELIILDIVAEKLGYNINNDFKSLKHVLVSGRIVPPVLREYLEQRWKVSLTSVYGNTEGGGIASTCHAWSLHIHPDAFILEILDPKTLQPVSPGDIGVLVITSYYRHAAPLFRYITRDICRMITEPCSCGDTAPIIQVLGRMDDEVILKGKELYFYDIEQSVLEFAKQFDSAVYFVIVTNKCLHIRVESHNSINKPSRESMNLLQNALDVPLKVHITSKGELLDPGFLTRAPNVYKPHNVSYWNKPRRRCVTLTESLIEFPRVGAFGFADITRRFFKNIWLRKMFR